MIHRFVPFAPFARALALAALAGLLLAVPRATRAEPFLLPLEREGSWTASDKTLHFAGSAALALSARAAGRREEASIGIAFGFGILKEAYDGTLKPVRAGRGASRKDLVVDLLGAAAGVFLFRALDR